MFPDKDNFESMFTLESEKGGVIEEKPFRLLILGDWSGDAEKNSFFERPFIEIDRDNFDAVLNCLQTKLEIELFDGDETTLTLEFSEFEDFHPDNIYRRVSLFADLRDLRRRLSDSETFNSAAREVRKWFEPADSFFAQTANQEAKSVDSNELLDQILSGKSENVRMQIQHSTELNELLKNLVRPFLVDYDENEQKSLIAAVDKAIGTLMRSILHHQKFQRLESAWRSLYFLVRNAETNSQLKIYILDAAKSELVDKLKTANNLADSEVYRKIIAEAENRFDGEMFAAIIGNFDFEPKIDDIAALMRLSKIAYTAHAPFISRMTEEVLGLKSFASSDDFRDLKFSFETDAGKLWNALRSQPESKFLGMTINRFLTRLPYGAKTDEIESFSFEEFESVPTHEQYAWGNASLLCGLLLAQSFSRVGWEMLNKFSRDVDGLPVYIHFDESESFAKSNSEIYLTQSECEGLLNCGLMPLISARDSDLVRLARFQSVANPVTILKGRWNL